MTIQLVAVTDRSPALLEQLVRIWQCSVEATHLFLTSDDYTVNQLTVNEQNPKAKGFYEHMGFHVYQRTDMDEQGNSYSEKRVIYADVFYGTKKILFFGISC